MEENNSDLKSDIRKLRKKLRKIERLEQILTKRELNVEEAEKVSRKWEYEQQLRELETCNGTSHGLQDAAAAYSPIHPFSPHRSRYFQLPIWSTSLDYDLLTFEGHAENVQSVEAFNSKTSSSDSSFFISSSSDTTARMWEVNPITLESDTIPNYSEKVSFSGHTATVTSCMVFEGHRWLSPDMLAFITRSNNVSLASDEPIDLLMTCSLDCYLTIWGLESGKKLFSLYTYQPITQMAVVDVDLVMTGTENGKLELWNLQERQAIHSTLFDQNANAIEWIIRADDAGRIVVCSKSGFMGVFELTSDPLVGAMIHQLYSSDELKTSRGEMYTLRKVTAFAAHDCRIYVTTLHRPTIKAISWGAESDSTHQPSNFMTVSRFAGRHFDSGCFVALSIWNPSASVDDTSYLFAAEYSKNSQLAIHIHSLPHKNYALSNFYVGSWVVPFDDLSMIRPLHLTVASMNVIKQGLSQEQNDCSIVPSLVFSVGNKFQVMVPSVLPRTGKNPENEAKYIISQLELYPKPSVCNLSMALNDSFSDDDDNDEDVEEDTEANRKSGDRLTTVDGEVGAVVVTASTRRIPGLKKARLETIGPSEDDDNPPTDVEEDDADLDPNLNPQVPEQGQWGIKKICTIL